jgi:hypothetical protein
MMSVRGFPAGYHKHGVTIEKTAPLAKNCFLLVLNDSFACPTIVLFFYTLTTYTVQQRT